MKPSDNTQPRHLLVVEDDDVDALLLERLMTAGGDVYRTDVVSTLNDALRWLQQQTADLILLDQSLPDCQGLGGISQIRDHHPTIPIVMLTGLDDDLMAARAIEMGAADYLIKGDCDPQVFANKLQRAMKSQADPASLRGLAT